MEQVNVLNSVAAFVGGFISFLFGGFDMLLQIMVVLVIIDYVSGLLKGWSTKTVSSQIGCKGIIKKVFIFLIIALAYLVQRIMDTQIPIRDIIIMFYIANEGISIIENAAACGLPVPKIIINVLEQLKQRGDNDAESKGTVDTNQK